MLIISPEARAVLQNLLIEHPEERVVRLAVRDLDEQRLAINISLEQAPYPEDRVQENQGITLAIAADSVSRLDGATLQYADHAFRLEHPNPPLRELRLISPN
jgi:Fe-S cluster assembly iron-binding protein IscA